jgi:hypothetical protein
MTLDRSHSESTLGKTSGRPRLDIASAPVEDVQEQSLADPNSESGAAAVGTRPATTTITEANIPADRAADDELPAAFQQGSPDPGALWIDGGQFSRRGYADQVAMRIRASVRSEGQGRQIVYIVREGPFQRTSEADAALDQARRAGVTGARIIVE